MASNLKKWRESATLLLVAKQVFWPCTKNNNYKILTMKRSSKSNFMADTHVFPGGSLDKADCSKDWLKLYQNFGISEKYFDVFKQVKYISPIFVNDGNLPRYISLRICAIREAFEECGVLICKSIKTENNGNKTQWASYFGGLNVEEWQKRVHNDASKFIEMCEKFQIYPDIWSLHEWSNWLTPVGMTRRFDTIFFLASLQNMPSTSAEKHEVQHIEWATPRDLIEKSAKRKIFLAPPQFYELSRLINFSKIEKLSEFSQTRSLLGTERFLPYRLSTEKLTATLLPGDDMYPGEEVAQIETNDILEEIPTCEIMHRIIYPDPFNYQILLDNYTPQVEHVMPIITNSAKL